MMRYSNRTLSFLLMILSYSCFGGHTEWDVEHIGEQRIIISDLCQVDTVILDGRRTSLLGQWIMARDGFCFFDECLVGIKNFALNGEYLSEHLNHGRGPDEMISPAWVTAYDHVSNIFVLQDSNAYLHILDSTFHIIWETPHPWFVPSLNGSQERMASLYLHPDEDAYEIYEYNMDCNRMQVLNGQLIMPIVSDHIRFNKYYKSQHSKKYFRKAHTMMLYPLRDTLTHPVLFGHYPPIYRQGDLAMFSEYDFFVDDSCIFLSFAADPNIYQMGFNGQVIRSFGTREEGISGKYPPIKTFEQYEREYKRQRLQFGYYGRLFCTNGLIFRTVKLDGQGAWRLQIYERETLLQVGEVSLSSEIEMLGYRDPYYYAYVGEDLKSDSFKIIRFSL